MRIGFDTSPLASQRSGIGNYAANLLRELLALTAGTDEIRALSTGRTAPDYADLGLRLDARHVPLPTRVMYAIWNTLRAPAADAMLGGVDVYHATNFFLPPVREAKRVLSVPDASFAVVPELCSPKIVGPFATAVPKFAKEADIVLTISEASKRDIVERFGVPEERIRVTYPGAGARLRTMRIDEARSLAARAIGVDEPFMLFVSTLEPRKNIPGLVRAFDRAAETVPHHLVLAGQLGWNTAPILESLNNARHNTRIHRLGYTDDDTLSALYSAADLFVFPSFYEGFGLPVIEAMTMGCPVVTANNSALPEAGGDAALYVEAGDDEALAETIRDLLNDETERRAMAQRGRQHAAQFTWRACAEATLAAYRE